MGSRTFEALERILTEITKERLRQNQKWGFPQYRTTAEWCTILAEEFGEVSMEANECHFRAKDSAELEVELIQVAAVCVSWLEHIRAGAVES